MRKQKEKIQGGVRKEYLSVSFTEKPIENEKRKEERQNYLKRGKQAKEEGENENEIFIPLEQKARVNKMTV